MNRRLERELLDDLPVSDARAIRSRQDLRRVNLWMGNVGGQDRGIVPVQYT